MTGINTLTAAEVVATAGQRRSGTPLRCEIRGLDNPGVGNLGFVVELLDQFWARRFEQANARVKRRPCRPRAGYLHFIDEGN